MKKNSYSLLTTHYPLKKGFSLLELLVVIGIVSILLAIGFVSYGAVQRRARDSKRRSDLKALQQAAEQYYSICGNAYPTSFRTQGVICTSPSTAILPANRVPKDPKSGTNYNCIGASCDTDSSAFELCATPEVEPTICVSSQQ